MFDIFSQNRAGKDSEQGSANKIRESILSCKIEEEIDTANNQIQPSELQFLTEYRSMKTACHELCHVFGMTHCPYFECLMNGSNLMNEAD